MADLCGKSAAGATMAEQGRSNTSWHLQLRQEPDGDHEAGLLVGIPTLHSLARLQALLLNPASPVLETSSCCCSSVAGSLTTSI